MRILSSPERHLYNVVTRQLIPWATGGSGFVSLDAPPKSLGTHTIIEEPGEALPLKAERYGSTLARRAWPGINLNSLAVPYMGCVLEGEADIVVGTTTAMCRKLKIPGTRWTIQMPQGTFFMVPPGTPVSRGMEPYWKRPNLEKAYSHIIWMLVHDRGVNIHFGITQNGKYTRHSQIFVRSKHLLPLAQLIVNEMTTRSPHYVPLIYLHLAILFHRLARSLENELPRSLSETSVLHDFTTETVNPHYSVQNAVDFIDENISSIELNAEKIAAHVRFSTSHLNRLFHRQFGMPIMRFVWQRRLEMGRELLLHSSYNVMQIGHRCGYVHISSFIEAFIRKYGISPTEYRRQHLDNERFK